MRAAVVTAPRRGVCLRRSLLSITAVLLTLGWYASAHAQIAEVYGGFTAPHFSQITTGYTGSQPNYASYTPYGFWLGANLRVLPVPIVRLSIDARGYFRSGIQNSFDSGLFGLNGQLKLPHFKLKPYIEAAAGYAATHAKNTSDASSGKQTTDGAFTEHYPVYEILGGVDYPIIPFVDWRVIDIGGGSSFTSSPNTSFYTVSTGVMVHF
jgi:hypothetical protein